MTRVPRVPAGPGGVARLRGLAISRLAGGLLLASLLVVAAPADAAAALQWYQLYERGLERAAAGNWTAAVEDFRAAERLEPRPRERVRTYGNNFLTRYDPPFQEARALVALERWDEAERALDRADGAAVTAAAERSALRRRLQAGRERAGRERAGRGTPLERGRLRIDSEPEGAEVRLDGRAAGRTPLGPVELAEGLHRVEVRAAGRRTVSQDVTVAADEAIHLQVVLPPAAPDGEDAPSQEVGGAGVLPTARAPRGAAPRGSEEPAGTGPPAVPREAGTAGVGRGDPESGEGEAAAPVGEEPGGGAARTGASPSPPPNAADEGTAATTGNRPSGPEATSVLPSAPPASGAVVSPVPESSEGPAGGRRAARERDAPSVAARPEGPPAGETQGQPDSAALGGGESGGVPGRFRGTDLPRGVVASGLLALLAVGLLVAAGWRRWRRPTVAHPGERRAAWRLQTGADRRIGGYRVLDELGRGGMAVTYRARRLSDGRILALKIPHESGDPTYAERFVREGRLGETLHHPGIVRVHEAGEDRGLAFLAMELLPGRTLEEEIRQHPEGLPVERALEIARAIAEALDYAHGKGIVHRDLKPANVMLLPDGTLKVMDFGVARVEGQPGLTTSRIFFGSPVYAAPELIDPPSIGPRADLYSLGIVLYEMLEGHPPFTHESVLRLLDLHRTQPLPPLTRPVPPDLPPLLARLCAKDPASRHADAQSLLVALNHLLYTPTP